MLRPKRLMDREENDGSGSDVGIRTVSTKTELVKRLVQCCLVGTTTSSLALRATAKGGCGLCVGHVRQFGGESPLCNPMEVKH